MSKMKKEKSFEMMPTNSMGMEVENWWYESCEAMVGKGPTWATIYIIQSNEQGKGHASALIKHMKQHYEKQNLEFGTSTPLSPEMKHLAKKYNLKTY